MIFNKNQTYHLVFPRDDEAVVAERIAEILGEKCGLRVLAVSDEAVYDNEILFGAVDRALTRNLANDLSENDSYLAGVYRNHYVMLSNDRFGLAVGLEHLIDCLSREEGHVVELTSEVNVGGRVCNLTQNDAYLRTVRLARKIYGTYGSWLQKQVPLMSESDREDIALVDALIRRLGEGLVLSIGSSSALRRGHIVKCDRSDYSRTTYRTENGHIIIPSDLATRYFGVDPTQNGEFDLTSYVAESVEFTLTYHPAEGLVILLPAGSEGFADAESNAVYLARMQAFFNNPVLPEPVRTTEQTRQEVIYSQFGTALHYDYTEVTYDNYYSPAILIHTNADGSRVLYVAHEISRLRNHKETSTVTCLKESRDGGESWVTLAMAADMRWAGLIEHNGCLYLFGNRSSNGHCMVAEWKLCDGSFRSASLGMNAMGSAPCAVAIANGRIYRAQNGAVISAPADCDLLVGANWTVSNSPHKLILREDFERITGQKTDPDKRFWLEEGNVIVGPDGSLYAMYRLDATPTWGYAAIFRLSTDGTTLSTLENDGSIIRFPSNQSKFMIKRDPKSGEYLTFVSLPTGNFTHQRNVLGLAASSDLLHWRVLDTVLVDRQMMNNRQSIYAHAFQYVDFDFDGENILLLVREACGDTCVYHDGIAVTLYTLENYQNLLGK